MLATIDFVARHPVLRIYALLMFTASCAGAAAMPYRSLMAINTLHMSEQAFSLMMFLSTLTNVVFGVSIGILSDFAGDRRKLMAAIALIGAIGSLMIWTVETWWMMAISIIFILPLANINPLIYAGTRMETGGMAAGEAASVNSVVRTAMSASWVFIPVAVALLLEATGYGIMQVWAFGAALYVLCLALALIYLPANMREGSAPGGFSGFLTALRQLGDPSILFRLIAVSTICSVNWLNSFAQALIIKSTLGGTLSQAGFMASAVALMEIPAMLFWASVLRRIGPVATIVIGSVLYALYLCGLSLATSVHQIFLLIPVAGAAAGAILSVPISYFQDLFPGRPGLGTSLYPVQNFLGTGIAAGLFAGASHFTSYQGTVLIGAVVTLAASVALVVVERTLPRR